jgi:tetratricopeptide (TPR) repeat protein
MKALIGAQRVFMDVDGIHPGQNFAQAIDQTLARCTAALVVVGPRWIEILRERAARSEEDYVVHEIGAALKAKKTVVPVFVGGATVNSLSGLPEELADLSFHQAVELHDASFNDDCTRLAKNLKLTRSFSWLPLVSAAALLALLIIAAANFGLGPWRESHQRKIHIAQLLTTAAAQMSQVDYESATKSYQQVLELDAGNRVAQDGQVDAAMLWLENFHVLTPEGQKSEDIAAPILAQLKTVLEAGLARTNGHDERAADILAHLGWEHWMNEKIAFKEFGKAESFFEKALAIDPSNVFANAFLGNWLLQTNGDSKEALEHLDKAVATNKQRELVRSMQLGGLYQNDAPGMRAAFVKALNDVRIHNEPLDKDLRDRTSYLYDPTVSEPAEMHDTLAAVPPDDAWKTFEWLNPPRRGDSYGPIKGDFVHASLAELSGNRAAALTEFQALKGKLKAGHFDGRIADYVDAAIKRLT